MLGTLHLGHGAPQTLVRLDACLHFVVLRCLLLQVLVEGVVPLKLILDLLLASKLHVPVVSVEPDELRVGLVLRQDRAHHLVNRHDHLDPESVNHRHSYLTRNKLLFARIVDDLGEPLYLLELRVNS